jgi:hypothetical protein
VLVPLLIVAALVLWQLSRIEDAVDKVRTLLETALEEWRDRPQ